MRFHNFWCYRRLLFSTRFAKTVWNARKNLKADRGGLDLPAGPFMAELDITYRCNLRCRMCQRWQDPRNDELPLDTYRRLAREFAEMGVHQISVAGGEPLLRSDVFDIIAAFAGRGMSVNLCTNGMLVEKYGDDILESGAACVSVSLDGAADATHDRIRGHRGSLQAIEAGIAALLRRRSKGSPILRVRMTVSNANAVEMRGFLEKWEGRADDVLFQPVHHCADAYYTGMPAASSSVDPAVVSAQLAGTKLAGDPYMRSWIESAEAGEGLPDASCFAGVLMARVDPWGDVYPCLEQHVCVGSVRRQPFSGVWNSQAFDRERRRLACGKSCRCWYNNTALIGHFGRLIGRTLLNGRRRRSFRWRPGGPPSRSPSPPVSSAERPSRSGT